MAGTTPTIELLKQPVQPLPEALRPWHSWLTWFAPEIYPGIAEFLRRLNPLLGPVRGENRAENRSRMGWVIFSAKVTMSDYY
ncbi:hypothetical protein EKN56_07965 [Limnobaculum zhutongyuii]|uniref:Uncharacterized protein n=1 Tax=Limnobaculum zhutongyuii TaxID=2498113 RepID=A0A411WJF9_9GAMM|nr:hypothetical protein [Limnobaculum zhutongyuii]QBH96339.1 hypothetical protein EKN56_07965 [Limnobaculum zhutongyuii]TQS87072.1 hypothetical protein ELQ32_15295 [Limnobaculum zhutongyuii]